jgi:hypothetical protein
MEVDRFAESPFFILLFTMKVIYIAPKPILVYTILHYRYSCYFLLNLINLALKICGRSER